jgi:hypothetical protein
MKHLEMGKELKERGYLGQAEKIFCKIGADFDLAQMRKLLEAVTM